MKKKIVLVCMICFGVIASFFSLNASADSTPTTVHVPFLYEKYNSASVFEFYEEDLIIGEYWIKEFKVGYPVGESAPDFASTGMSTVDYRNAGSRNSSNRYACIDTFFKLENGYTQLKQPHSSKYRWSFGTEDNIAVSFYISSGSENVPRRKISYEDNSVSFQFICLDENYMPVAVRSKTSSTSNEITYSFYPSFKAKECIPSSTLKDYYSRGVRYFAINIYVGNADNVGIYPNGFPWTNIYNELTISLTSLPSVPQRFFDGYVNYQNAYKDGYKDGWETGNLEGFEDGYGNGSAEEYNRLMPILDEYKDGYNTLYDDYSKIVNEKSEFNSIIREKDATIANLNGAIVEKDKSIELLNTTIENQARARKNDNDLIQSLQKALKAYEDDSKTNYFEAHKTAIIVSSVSAGILILVIAAGIIWIIKRK